MTRLHPRPPVPVYREGRDCPGCWGRSWLIGRSTAECARCGAALPLADQARSAISKARGEQPS